MRCWTAWLMPDRETALTDKQRKDFGDTSGKLIHPMADDPRVGVDAAGKQAQWGQGDTYYKKTGDWRGNKSYYRSGFTRMMSTANFNSRQSSGALLNGQIIGSERAMADGRAGLMKFPFWMWTHSAGVGQEYIDHYYWAIATAGNKLFADFSEQPEDRMAGWSIITKTVNDLAGGYHPNPQEAAGAGQPHLLRARSRRTGRPVPRPARPFPAGSAQRYRHRRAARPDRREGRPRQHAASDKRLGTRLPARDGRPAKPVRPVGRAVDHRTDRREAAALVGPGREEGDPVSTYFGVNYGLTSIRQKPQRIHVLGQWRRKAERPSTMRDIGTLDMRIGFNQTQIANDGAGVISEQGHYRTYQHGNRLIMLARPNVEFLGQQKEIKSLQCTAALFNFEAPRRPGRSS